MTIIVLLIAAGGAVALGFLAAFVWAVRSGQFDDTTSPPHRMLRDAPASPQSLHPTRGSVHDDRV
jgi:cbb3-type cytochrome oxidase maturation protein